jgi:hypothetical protein
MTSVLAELSQWAAKHLKYWEQAALDKIVGGVAFTDADYDELLGYLLEDAGLAKPERTRPTLRFPKDADAEAKPAAPIRLVSISNLQNVNALVPGQTLTFGPRMTAVFGGNGSGKSGYARVLGCAGFTRGDREVLPDVTRPIDDSITLSADVQIEESGARRVIHYEIGRECPELGSCYVFDSTSVRAHLTKSNVLSFSPAGLSYLTRLAEVTDEVRDRLKAQVDECSQPHSFGVLFQGDSDVAPLIVELGPKTDLETLRRMARLSAEEKGRIDELDLTIAQLKTQDVSKQKDELAQRIADLEQLASQLREARERLSEEVVEEIHSAFQTYLDRRLAAQRLSVDQFKSEYFTQTGSDVWYRFVEAAKALADAEQMPDAPYPQSDSRCLLCQQPLSDEARELLIRLWAFLEGAAQAKLEEAETALREKRTALETLALDFFSDQSVSYRYLQEQDTAVFEAVKQYVAACRERRQAVLGSLADETWKEPFPALPKDGIAGIERIVESLRTQFEELDRKDPAEEIARLERERRNLQHRVTLGEHLEEVEAYVQKRGWAQKAAKVGGSTHHITRKHNELFAELVTNRYIELFEQMLKDLGRPLTVEVATKGHKGATYKQIVVRADPSAPEDMTTPDKVLSEGEKRAVALADFLTEVALDTTSSAVILDDPVTSLDLEWRVLIASILTSEAQRRQVIVFTHDLPFLYFLKQNCEQRDVELATHWVKRGEHDDRPGYVFLDNSPALERDYRKATRAREIYARAKDAAASEQEALLRDGFGALRTCYEAFIIFELFNGVVMRFDERISPGSLRGIVWDERIVRDVIDGHERLSQYIEGHLHSDALGAQKPEPSMLLGEVEAFDQLKRRLKDLREARQH